MYQSSRKKTRDIANNSFLHSNISSEHQLSNNKRYQLERLQWNRSKTEGHSNVVGDSLQSFQQELNSILISNRKKKTTKKKSFFPVIQAERPQEISEIRQIRNQMQEIKNLIQNKQKRSVEEKLEKIIIQLQNQKQRIRIRTQRNQFQQSHIKTQSQYQPPPPVYIPQPQIIYPPQPYFQPPYSHHLERTHRRKKRQSPESDEQYQEEYESEKKNTKQLFRARKVSKTPKSSSKSKKPLKNRLKIIFLAAFYFVSLKAEAKKNAASRRLNLQIFCKQKFYSQINNVKEWLLESQKVPFSIILEKKNLNFNYVNQLSSRVKEQKINLVIHIVSIGLKNLEGITVSKKIKPFAQLLSKLCLNKCYPINSLWTSEEMKQICVSQEFGFFKIDQSLQKFLIGLLVFVKIFIFNMLLQPFKFDNVNFEKKTQPMSSNMKLISSIYYLLAKEVLKQYLSNKRSKTFYKIGNYEAARMAKVKCSQPLVYEKSKLMPAQYISGLYGEEILKDLKQYEFWELCLKNMKHIIESIHGHLKSPKY